MPRTTTIPLTRNGSPYLSHLKFASRGSLAKAVRSYSIDNRGDSHRARAPCASRWSFHDIRSSGSGFVKTVQLRIARLASPFGSLTDLYLMISKPKERAASANACDAE